MRIGEISVSWRLTCKNCKHIVKGGTEKRVWVWFYFHMLFRHFKTFERKAYTAWQLFKYLRKP